MTNLLDDTIESAAPLAPTTALPPPPPSVPAALIAPAVPVTTATPVTPLTEPIGHGGDTPDEEIAGPPNVKALAITAAIAVGAAIVMGLLWMSAGGARDDAATARDEAIAERDAGAERARSTGDALISTQSQLDAATASEQQLQAEFDVAQVALADRAEVVQANDELTAEVADLTTRNVDLAKQVTEIEADLALAGAADPTAAAFDVTAAPDFARFVGEQLSSMSGSNELGQGQTLCLGTAVINDIGLDALGKGLAGSPTPAAIDAVETAMRSAAATCGIDPSAIF